MNRGESSGGGQSSLGYLFGSEEKPNQPLPTRTAPLPPYGIDIDNAAPPHAVAPSNTQLVVSNNRSQGHHLGNIVTVSFNSMTIFHIILIVILISYLLI